MLRIFKKNPSVTIPSRCATAPCQGAFPLFRSPSGSPVALPMQCSGSFDGRIRWVLLITVTDFKKIRPSQSPVAVRQPLVKGHSPSSAPPPGALSLCQCNAPVHLMGLCQNECFDTAPLRCKRHIIVFRHTRQAMSFRKRAER